MTSPGCNNPTGIARLIPHAVAALLVGAFFLQCFSASLVKSPSSDEPSDIAAGLSHVIDGNFLPVPEHPPLLKEMSGVCLFMAGVRLPRNTETQEMLDGQRGVFGVLLLGNSIIATNGIRKVMFWARLPVIVLSTLLAVLIYVWARQIAGDIAALAALFLYAFDPNLLAHSALGSTDVALAAFATCFFFSLWSYLRRPSRMWLLLCGFTMGLALSARFSALFMVPIAVPIMLLSATRGVFGDRSGKSAERRLMECARDFFVMCCVAAVVIMAVYRSPAGLSMYIHGLGSIYPNNDPNYLRYLAGQLRPRFYTYFAAAWLFKEPIATIGLVLFGSLILLRDKALALSDKLMIFLPSAALFGACTLRANDIGIRYILPMFPFACLAGGIGAAWLIRNRSKAARGLAVLLGVWILVAAAGIYPDHLSYFNETACLLREPRKTGFDGGSKCGMYWLDDSNVDWGQGLQQLRAWLEVHPHPGTVRMAYLFSFGPRYYGIATEPAGIGEFDQVALPGRYVLSAHFMARHGDTWLRTIPPTAIVGHAYYIYDINQLQ